jgi:hypothetical protein
MKRPAARSVLSGVLVLLAFATGLALAPASAAAQNPRISNLVVKLDGHRVLVDFRLRHAFDAGMIERVQSGLPTTVVYELELLEDRKRWFDDRLDRSELHVVAMYDGLAREYLVNYKLNGRLIESRMVESLPELEIALTRFDDLPAFTLVGGGRRDRLLIKVRAQLGSKTLLSFIPTRIDTNWKESAKFRRPASPPP